MTGRSNFESVPPIIKKRKLTTDKKLSNDFYLFLVTVATYAFAILRAKVKYIASKTVLRISKDWSNSSM